MNSETDRIAVPTNGRKPHDVPGPASPEPADRDATARDPRERDPVARVTSPDVTVAVTPAQLAVGFSVIAGIILLALRRRRGRRRE